MTYMTWSKIADKQNAFISCGRVIWEPACWGDNMTVELLWQILEEHYQQELGLDSLRVYTGESWTGGGNISFMPRENTIIEVAYLYSGIKEFYMLDYSDPLFFDKLPKLS